MVSSKKRHLLQNIKYLIRQETNDNQNSYKDEVFYEVISNREQLHENLFKNFINKRYCNDKKINLWLIFLFLLYYYFNPKTY